MYKSEPTQVTTEPLVLSGGFTPSAFDMTMLKLDNYALLLIAFILMIVYSFVLVMIWKGNRNVWLTWVTCQLMLSNLGSVILVVFFARLFI